jgi:ADP-L-glycero-D-manno-heptose 6-epimerase
VKKEIIISGTRGFIGSNLKKVLSLEYEIKEINENIFESPNWKNLASHFFSGNVEAVFHVGACSDTLEQNVNYMMLVNYEFTRFLSDLCYSTGIPLIYSSSAANYGTNGEYPSNLYGWSKYSAENYVTSRGGIALRYFNVYGPGEQSKGRMASVAYQMIEKFKSGESVNLFPGKPTRDFVYVKDVVSANVHAFEKYSLLKGEYYEVGSGESRPFEDVLNVLEIPFTYHPEEFIPEGYQFFTMSDSTKWMPGWSPEWNLEKGLSDYFDLDI